MQPLCWSSFIYSADEDEKEEDEALGISIIDSLTLHSGGSAPQTCADNYCDFVSESFPDSFTVSVISVNSWSFTHEAWLGKLPTIPHTVWNFWRHFLFLYYVS